MAAAHHQCLPGRWLASCRGNRGDFDIAKRALQTCSRILRYAAAHGLAKSKPAVEIRPSDVLVLRKKENVARLDRKELPEPPRRIEVCTGNPVTRVAIKPMAIAFVRTPVADGYAPLVEGR